MATATEMLIAGAIGVFIGVSWSEKIRTTFPNVFPVGQPMRMNQWDSDINRGFKERPPGYYGMWRQR